MKHGIRLILASLCGTVVSSIGTTDGGYQPAKVLQSISSGVPTTEKDQKNHKFLGSFRPSLSMPTATLEVDSSAGPVVSRHQREMALRDTVKAFTAAGVKFVLSAGGALGIIRSGRLPDKDDDIDLLVTDATFHLARKALLNMRTSSGQKVQQWSVKGQTRAKGPEFIQFRANGWGPVDVWRIDEPKTRSTDLLCVPHYSTIIPKSMFFPARLVRTKLGFTVPIPNAQERFAEYYYGAEWRFPRLEKSKRMANCGGGPKSFHTAFFKACPVYRMENTDWVYYPPVDNFLKETKIRSC